MIKLKTYKTFIKNQEKKIKSKKNKDSNWNNQNKYDQLVHFKKGKRKKKKNHWLQTTHHLSTCIILGEKVHNITSKKMVKNDI
jgi:cytoskeletal protein RodZ